MIADRTYHRLLHVDWIRADVDGDGLAEFVPQSDRPGAREPKRAYSLFSLEPSPTPTPKPSSRFLLGGSIYDGWTTRAGQVQSQRSEAAGPEPLDRRHLPIRLVICRQADAEARTRRGSRTLMKA